MTAARSLFTEAIEDHLALKKQNAALEGTMPLARYDVGDPLERFPGGPGRSAEGTVVVADATPDVTGESMFDDLNAAALVGPSPEQAMEAATALETNVGGRPFEPLMGMAPMLSLVEDIEDEQTGQFAVTEAPVDPAADVLRFPGGVGPRDQSTDAPAETPVVDPLVTQAFTMPTAATPAQPAAPAGDDFLLADEAATGEQPVLVIDTDDSFATSNWNDEPATASRSERKSARPRFFGLGRKKDKAESKDDAWFSDGARDFNWD